ncbi:unnamed protein product [Mytilus coruscus]|uniref:CARD domain-containing protein n=1 Tax=Mytilus coruscus TaxID=42192 RepID=A0A6J8A1C4_MYTCO|nr:unnamed protein product [Mytilus coruscus]
MNSKDNFEEIGRRNCSDSPDQYPNTNDEQGTPDTQKELKTTSFFESPKPPNRKSLDIDSFELLNYDIRNNCSTRLTANKSTENMNGTPDTQKELKTTSFFESPKPPNRKSLDIDSFELLNYDIGNNCSTRLTANKSTENMNGKWTEQVNWKHKIIRRFNYLRENIGAVNLLKKMYNEGFLAEGSVNIQISDQQHIKSTQVMIAVAKRITDESSFNKFKDILRKCGDECCAVYLEQKHKSSERTADFKDHTAMLTEAKTTMEEAFQTLNQRKLLNIVGTFVEQMIFDLKDIEELVDYIHKKQNRQMAIFLTDNLIKKTDKGSCRCLIELLKKDTKNKEMTQICKKIEPHIHQAQNQEGCETPTASRIKSIENSMLRDVAKKLPRKLCEEYDLKVTQVKPGSIIIYLKSMKRDNLNKTDIMEKLFKDRYMIESLKPFIEDKEIELLCPGITIVLDGCEITANKEESRDAKHSPLSTIEANRSFLIEEIDTGILLAAFKKKGINCFEQKGFDLKADRRTKATKFLEIVESTDKTEMLMNILEEEEMEDMRYISIRLRTYERIIKTDVDSSTLARSILLKFEELVNILGIDDIEDIFLERRFFNQKIFDDIHETFGDLSVAAILIQILNSGKDAMLSLIDALFLKGKSDLGQMFLNSASAESRCQKVHSMTEKVSEDNFSYAGTEFSITIALEDLADETSGADHGGSMESGECSDQSSCDKGLNQSEVILDS